MTAETRLPHFIIGGAPRSGTTFLCHALERHPTLFLAKPYIPEPKVFMGERRTPEDYRHRYADLFAPAQPGQTLGEKTSYYLESAQACSLIREVAPATRLIFVVREPVSRAYSNYLWSKRNGLETLPFDDAIALEGSRPDPMPPEKSYARPFDYLERGDYAVFARRYYGAFPREQVRFFLFEDIEANPQRLLDAIQRYIGVDPIPFASLDPGVVNAARDLGPPISVETEERLRRQMMPKVRDFAELTGLDVSSWGYGSGVRVPEPVSTSATDSRQRHVSGSMDGD